jgi:hypothetical protein
MTSERIKGWALVRSFFAFHFMRRYPRWAGWLPRHVPRLIPAGATDRDPPRQGLTSHEVDGSAWWPVA